MLWRWRPCINSGHQLSTDLWMSPQPGRAVMTSCTAPWWGSSPAGAGILAVWSSALLKSCRANLQKIQRSQLLTINVKNNASQSPVEKSHASGRSLQLAGNWRSQPWGSSWLDHWNQVVIGTMAGDNGTSLLLRWWKNYLPQPHLWSRWVFNK